MDTMSERNGELDSRIEIVTPENIAFQYRVAGPFRRLPAFLIDMMICLVTYAVISFAIMMISFWLGIPNLGVGASLLILFLLTWFYGGLFETFCNGQTPGKRLMEIRVLSVDGRPIDGLQAVLRNILRAVDAPPPFFLPIGLVAAAMNRRFQRLGDLAAGTMVVVEEPRWFHGVVRISDPQAVWLAGQIPPGFQASRSLARALALYVQRRLHLAWPRRMEVAAHVAAPLRDRFQLPAATDPDQLLCGLYHRTFITERSGEPWSASGSPFAPGASIAAGPPPAELAAAGPPPPPAGSIVAGTPFSPAPPATAPPTRPARLLPSGTPPAATGRGNRR